MQHARPSLRTTRGPRRRLPWPVAAPVALATAPTASATTTTDLAKQVVTLVNAEREEGRVRSRARQPRADHGRDGAHSDDMAKYNYFSHTSRDGRTPWQRIRAAGYYYGSAENIAAGQTTAKSVVYAWMHSAGHRKNILTCSNKAMGVGVARGGYYGIYWTQDFGRR